MKFELLKDLVKKQVSIKTEYNEILKEIEEEIKDVLIPFKDLKFQVGNEECEISSCSGSFNQLSFEVNYSFVVEFKKQRKKFVESSTITIIGDKIESTYWTPTQSFINLGTSRFDDPVALYLKEILDKEKIKGGNKND